jgi:hypothetical protein
MLKRLSVLLVYAALGRAAAASLRTETSGSEPYFRIGFLLEFWLARFGTVLLRNIRVFSNQFLVLHFCSSISLVVDAYFFVALNSASKLANSGRLWRLLNSGSLRASSVE